MKKNVLWIVIAILSFTVAEGRSFIPVGDSVGVSTINGKKHVQYKVEPGETIYRIATAYKISVTELLEINPELNNGLKVGQIIHLPYNHNLIYSRKTTAAPSKIESQDTSNNPGISGNETIAHMVQPGETLYGISRKYGVAIEDIKVKNGWELKAGEEVFVMLPAKAPTPTENQLAVKEGKNKTESFDSFVPEGQKEQIIPEPVKQEPKKEVIVKATSAQIREDSLRMDLANNNSQSSFSHDGAKRVLVIPFDPYLYFSDADDEIATKSKMQRDKIRQVFRRRLNVLIDPPGYETIHLLGGSAKDSLMDLNRIYSSVKYNYHDILYNDPLKVKPGSDGIEIGAPAPVEKSWAQKQKEKIITVNQQTATKTGNSRDNGKYFGVKITDQEFYNYFNNKYGISYYVFINQFEVKTNYENCLDRAAQDYERNFIAHFSIFDNTGKQVAGNKVKIYYNSNSNSIFQIVNDNMQKMADAILSELPR